ncbi:MAG: hypothetical protein EHM89_00215 [Acidobacteria bacterium]|nr:MAG: hypothetical protein EHM89_00215 [Acidobacteriota bacterium]
MAPQPTLGTDPTAGWAQLQIDKASLQNWKKTLQTVERNIHSKFMVPRKGDVVGWSVSPALAHDCNKDFMDLVAEPAFRCVGQHPGGTDQRVYRPTVVVDGGGSNDSFTVPSNGALPNGVLIYARGFTNTANNALFVTAGTSTATAIKVATATLVAEATAPANATLDVVGFQGASADITMNASGHLTSTVLDFTTLDLKKGMLLKIGGTASNTFFATAAINGWAYIASTPTANLIELEGWTFTPAADTGTGKTIQIFASSLYRNYAIDDAAYAKKLLAGELEEPLAGADSTTRYQYLEGLLPNTLEIAAPLKSKITATLSMIGTDASDPVAVASRVGGAGSVAGDSPAQAYSPLATALMDTANDLAFIRIRDSGGALLAEVNDWNLTIGNAVSPKEVQGTPGAVGHHVGEFTHKLTTTAYYTDSDQVAAAADNRDLDFDVCLWNHQFAFAFRLPACAMRNDNRQYEANMQVKLSFETPAFGSESTNVAGQLCIFGYVPGSES